MNVPSVSSRRAFTLIELLVVISILATFYPALLGARVRPATGMRH